MPMDLIPVCAVELGYHSRNHFFRQKSLILDLFLGLVGFFLQHMDLWMVQNTYWWGYWQVLWVEKVIQEKNCLHIKSWGPLFSGTWVEVNERDHFLNPQNPLLASPTHVLWLSKVCGWEKKTHIGQKTVLAKNCQFSLSQLWSTNKISIKWRKKYVPCL